MTSIPSFVVQQFVVHTHRKNESTPPLFLPQPSKGATPCISFSPPSWVSNVTVQVSAGEPTVSNDLPMRAIPPASAEAAGDDFLPPLSFSEP